MFPRTVFILTACSFLIVQAAGASRSGREPGQWSGMWSGKACLNGLWEPKTNCAQVMMATTNGTFGSQTFGISSGTSGCTNDGVIMKNKHINMASRSFESLAGDMAQGRGEHLASLATLLGVPEEAQPEFFALVQEKYTLLVGSDDTTAVTMLQVIQAAMADVLPLPKCPLLTRICRRRSDNERNTTGPFSMILRIGKRCRSEAQDSHTGIR